MKTNIVILTLAALLGAGCGSGSASKGDSVTGPSGNGPVQKQAVDQKSEAVQETETAAGEENSSVTEPVGSRKQASRKQAGWYMRTVVSTTLPDGRRIVHNTAGVFGQLDDSSDGLDRHDIEAYGKAVFQVRFINADLAYKKEYFSDYRAWDQNGSSGRWTFQIRNQTGYNLADAMFRIGVEGPFDVYRDSKGKFEETPSQNDLKKRLILRDLDHETHYTYGELKTLYFSMDGKHTRNFQWVLGEEVWTPVPFPAKLRAAARVKADEFDAGVKAGSSKFGLPPE